MIRQELNFLLFKDTKVPEGTFEGVVRVNDFADLAHCYPFTIGAERCAEDRPLHVFLDLDGAVSTPFTPSDIQTEGVRRMYALRQIAESADAITVWSSRLVPNEGSVIWQRALKPLFDPRTAARQHVSRFPFLTVGSQQRLAQFIKHANPDCTVNYALGTEKLLKGKDLTTTALGLLVEGSRVAVVGSSIFDRRSMMDLVHVMEDAEYKHLFPYLHYFDTNHIVL